MMSAKCIGISIINFTRVVDAGEKQFFVPDEGPVKISCTDDKGRNRDIKITVKLVNL
ncbi:MAG: hypothetical protein WDN26_01485 [Chitinophagaceae bacterium]